MQNVLKTRDYTSSTNKSTNNLVERYLDEKKEDEDGSILAI
jgi:hypothetical protein